MMLLNRNKKNKVKKLFIALLSMFIILCIYGCSLNADNNADIAKKEITGKLTIDFINVGKGDCAVIRTDNYCVMIDTGYEETSKDVIDFLNKEGIRTIDILIITHFDKDHVGGAIDIMDNINVLQIFMPDYEDTGNKYAKFKSYLTKKGKMGIVNYLTSDTRISADAATFDMYAPKADNYEEENDYSIITKVTNMDKTYMFAGDAEEDRINEVLGKSMLDCDVLKVPHHGELDKNTIQFIEEVSPEYAVVTCGKEDEVSTSIIYEFELLGTECYFNCNGNIRMEYDGNGNLTVTQ